MIDFVKYANYDWDLKLRKVTQNPLKTPHHIVVDEDSYAIVFKNLELLRSKAIYYIINRAIRITEHIAPNASNKVVLITTMFLSTAHLEEVKMRY